MQPLEKPLRNRLERTVTEARTTAETAAKVALDQLGVGVAAPFSHLKERERELRRKLRVHGRQLGDVRDAKAETQELYRLVEEVAYEHWHRMLFARFLAENDLLMYPDPTSPVAVTLQECEDLAADEGAANGWELASRFAARMLPQIFRPDSPVFQLTLPPEYEQKLEKLVGELPVEVFKASDSLGWVYQFWQSKKKEEVNASEVKIGARELPAVTQLFTEPYMVSFLLDNSLGAWWAARRLTKNDLATAKSEEELRQKASLPGMPLEYLRFIKGEDGIWTPAAGTFDGWPEHLSKLKTLDPCAGSGHFLVAALLMLVAMRMELERLSAKDAVDAVLRDNLHGLEIDQRCVELAAFALALTAWRYPKAGGYRPLPELNVACSGLSVSVAKEEWEKLGGSNHNLSIALGSLHDEFQNAPVLGSLLNPAKRNVQKIVEWDELAKVVGKAFVKEHTDEEREVGVAAQGLAKAATLLAGQYNLVITNVPYLARAKQSETLREYCEKHHNEAKNDLATVFLERCLELCVKGGTSSIVLPQNWLFLTGYKRFRENLLKTDTWHMIVRLGPGAFETISGEVVKAILITLSRGGRFGEAEIANLIRELDVSKLRTAAEKATQLLISEVKSVEQVKQLKNPDARIVFGGQHSLELLENMAESFQGIKTGDDNRFKRFIWEHNTFTRWRFSCGSPQSDSKVGYSYILDWINSGKNFARFQGLKAYNRSGICLTNVGRISSFPYFGTPFTSEVTVIVPKNEATILLELCSFIADTQFENEVRKIDQNLAVSTSVVIKVPFDLNHWTRIAAEKYPNGLPKPYSDDPTQWIFHGHPARSDEPLQVAVARLLGYRWPAEMDSTMELSDEARAWVKKSETLLPYADDDGIVCIPPVRGEMKAEDRLGNLLAAAYGTEWSSSKKSELLAQADHEGKTLESWLREKFFTQHCKLFHHRPFIWHIWDGLRDGFAALVNYHKLDYKLLETLIYTYLGDWISRQKQDKANGVDGADEKLAAAEALKKRLELILEGEAPYDIFVRWKPIEKQPIGWNPDLNDGVRLNIRPFMSVPDVKKKGAGVLFDKPNVKWGKDRGKDVESAPWYTLGLQYGGKEGDRINDHHLSLAEKRAVREVTE